MDVTITREGSDAIVTVVGRIDTVTSRDLEAAVAEVPDDAERIIFDFDAMNYIASSGLRVILATLKRQRANGGTVVLRNVKPLVMEVLDATGFTELFEIE